MMIRTPTVAFTRLVRLNLPRLGLVVAVGVISGSLWVGCTGLDLLFGPLPDNSNDNMSDTIGIAVAEPSVPVTAAPGVTTRVRWADIATFDGTVVRITAQRRNTDGEDTADPIQLVGDGTSGTGRDALADGDNDIFNWDIAGVRVGAYTIIGTIEAPDGSLKTVESLNADRGINGVIVVTTALPVPTLTFTAPGASDVTVTTGNTFTFTWTDNGTSNPDAVLRLGLDTDADHDNGNEVTLLADQALSENGNAGSFVFDFLDAEGNTVPDDTYTVFAILDDNANDPVTVSAIGELVLNP